MSDAGSDADILLSELPPSNQSVYDRAIEECFKRQLGPAIAKAATDLLPGPVHKKEDVVILGDKILDAAAEFGVSKSTEILTALEEACECSFADKEAGQKWLATSFSRSVRQHVLADKLQEVDELYGTSLKTKPPNLKLQVIRWAALPECLEEVHSLLVVSDPPPDDEDEEEDGSDCSDIEDDDDSDDEDKEDDEGSESDGECVTIDPADLKEEARELGVIKKKSKKRTHSMAAASNGAGGE